MHDEFRNHASEKVLEQAEGESKIGPVVSIFHDIQGVPFEVHLPIKIHLMECLHGDLGSAMILRPMFLFFELQIMLYRAAGIPYFLVLAGRDGGGDIPERHENWDAKVGSVSASSI